MDLQVYLGNSLLKEIKNEVSGVVNDFSKQTQATKLKLADSNKFEAEAYKAGCKHLINALDQTGQELEASETLNKAYKEQYGEPNEEYIKKNTQIAVLDDNKSYAKKRLIKYIENCEKDKEKSKTAKK